MKLVLDNNVLFSIMNPKSAAAYLFSLLRADFFAPDFIKSEFDKYNEDCLSKSGLSEHEFEMRLQEAEKFIKFIKSPEYDAQLDKAIESLPNDPKDSPYVALALSINTVVWSNDPHLKQQSLVEVYTTAELIGKMLNEEI